MSSHILFKDGGAGLFSVKSICVGCGISASAGGDGSVTAAAGDGNGNVIVSSALTGDRSVAVSGAGDGSVASGTGDGSVTADVGDGIVVGLMGISG